MKQQPSVGLGELILDHYSTYLGAFRGHHAFREGDDSPQIQVLEYRGVVPGCRVLATLGFGRFSLAAGSRFLQVVAAVADPSEGVEDFMGRAMYAIAKRGLSLEIGMSFGGLEGASPRFAKDSGKSGLYFCEPFPFHEQFRFPTGRGVGAELLMAIPIAKSEREFLKRWGAVRFECLLEGEDVDVFDSTRTPVV